MTIVVFGATGSTGRHVVDQSLFAGHDVTAVVRRPNPVAARPHLVVRAGEVLDAASLRETCIGPDAVVSCVGPRSNVRPGTVVMSSGTAHMVGAAEAAGVRRFVSKSGIGLSDRVELLLANRRRR